MKREDKNRKYLEIDLETYKYLIIEDIKANSKFAQLISELFIAKPNSLKEWIEGISGKSFKTYNEKGNVTLSLPDPSKLENINYTFSYFSTTEMGERYSFFSSYGYSTYEEAASDFPKFYYVFDRSFFSKINEKLLRHFKDFEPIRNQYI